MSAHGIYIPREGEEEGRCVPMSESQRARIYRLEAEAREGQAAMMDEWLKTEAGQRWLGTWKED